MGKGNISNGGSNCRNQSALVSKYWYTVSLRIFPWGCWWLVDSFEYELRNPVYFIKVFKLMSSVLSLVLVCLDQLVFLCFSFSFPINCLKLKYALSYCETSKLHLLHKMRLNFKRMFLSTINKNKIVEHVFIFNLIPLLQIVISDCFLTVWLHVYCKLEYSLVIQFQHNIF